MEFALVVPLLLLLLLGILQYSYLFWSKETAAATAREAARRYAVGTQQACTVQEAKDRAAPAALGAVTVSAPPTAPRVGDIISVTVSFQGLDVHLLPIPDGGWISETVQVRVESVPATPRAC